MAESKQVAYLKKINQKLYRDFTNKDIQLMGSMSRLNRQKKAFTLLVELQKEIALTTDNREFYHSTARLINATMEMTASYIYKPSEKNPEQLEILEYHISNKNKEKFTRKIERVHLKNIHSLGKYLLLNRYLPENNGHYYLKKLFNLQSMIVTPVFYEDDITLVIISGVTMVDGALMSDLTEEDAHALEAVGILISSYLRKAELIKMYETDKIKTEFISNLSHEFRTPLTLVLGLLEDLHEKYDGGITREDNVSFEIVRKNALRIRELIDQLLDISKLETETETLSVKPTMLGEFVNRLTNSFSSLARKKKINFHYSFDAASIETWFDADKLEKIITNLLSNAFKFTPAGGTVMLDVKLNPKGKKSLASFTVEDTGPGIPVNEQKLVFNRFYQVKNNVAGKSEGTGVGLYLVQKLTRLHHGSLELKSSTGKGARFIVSIPVDRNAYTEEERFISDLDSDQDNSAPVQSLEQQLKPAKNKKRARDKNTARILIVEDNPDLNAFIATNLSNSFETISAFNGKEGLTYAEELIPDLIITDVMMPVIDGVEMTRQVKKNQKTNHIPVIMLTAKADKSSKYEGFEGGAEDYMVKPFDMNELALKVRNQIENNLRLQEKYRREIMFSPVEKEPGSNEDKLLRSVLHQIRDNVANTDFQVEDLCKKLYISRSQLFRKINALTGYTPAELMRTIRLKTAASMLSKGAGNVTQVMYEVGFSHPSNFARNFKKQYGVNPSAYIKEQFPHSSR